jgi:hypothetical protein
MATFPAGTSHNENDDGAYAADYGDDNVDDDDDDDNNNNNNHNGVMRFTRVSIFQ